MKSSKDRNQKTLIGYKDEIALEPQVVPKATEVESPQPSPEVTPEVSPQVVNVSASREPTVTILNGHNIAEMRKLPAGIVHTAVTSPPYYGLRDYSRCECTANRTRSNTTTVDGGDPNYEIGVPDPNCPKCHGSGRDPSLDVVWGGDESCEHAWGEKAGGLLHENRNMKSGTNEEVQGTGPLVAVGEDRTNIGGSFCQKCGAWYGQLGLEPTPDLYVEHLVLVFRELRRVLRDDGTLWLNLGDCYNGVGDRDGRTHARFSGKYAAASGRSALKTGTFDAPGLKPNDMIGIPWMAAFALREDGWWLRSDPIWAKPNPMPDSVDGWRWEQHMLEQLVKTDDGRMKRVRVRKPVIQKFMAANGETLEKQVGTEDVPCPGCDVCKPHGGFVLRKDSWRPTKAHEFVFMLAKSDTYFCDREAVREESDPDQEDHNLRYAKAYPAYDITSMEKMPDHPNSVGIHSRPGPGGRNLRTIWTISTAQYGEAHFATFPPKLVEPCIKAGASEGGCCATCGAPWARVVIKEPFPERTVPPGGKMDLEEEHFSGSRIAKARNAARAAGMGHDGYFRGPRTLGFRPTCGHDGDPVPCTVMDPFGGSGTVGQVAKELRRSAILVEIKREYVELAKVRVDMGQRSLGDYP